MHYRPLGRTGLNVSTLALGGAAIGQQYGPVSVAEVAETVHAGIDAGINFVDTADVAEIRAWELSPVAGCGAPPGIPGGMAGEPPIAPAGADDAEPA